ncbi:hypothetical protein GE21DRAFT_1037227 [Neurospora crassa]|nr:hypothetical protein GE21DRAFT_1037227 [Neurospora crassa]
MLRFYRLEVHSLWFRFLLPPHRGWGGGAGTGLNATELLMVFGAVLKLFMKLLLILLLPRVVWERTRGKRTAQDIASFLRVAMSREAALGAEGSRCARTLELAGSRGFDASGFSYRIGFFFWAVSYPGCLR